MILKKRKKSKNQTSNKEQKSATTQNSLMYIALFENGLMHVVDKIFSNTYELGAITYTTATDREQKNILSRYNAAINQLSEHEHFQLTLLITKNPKEKYMQEAAYQFQNDGFDELRNEFNHILEANYDRGRNNFKVERYITLSTEADNQRKAMQRLEVVSDMFAEELREINSPLTQLNGMERLKVMNKLLRPGKPLYGSYKEIECSKRTTKDMIAPNFLEFNMRTKLDFQMDDKYGEVLYLREFPRNLSDELFKNLTEAEVEMAITIHGTPYSILETNQRLRNEVTDIEIEVINREMKATSRGYSTQHIARTTKELKADLDEQLEFVSETGDKQISSTFMIYVWADSKEQLQQDVAKIKAVGNKFGAVFEPFYLTQEMALNASLPLGKNYMDFERMFLRDLITPNLSINSPYTSMDVQHEGGTYYGINQLSKNNILINRSGEEMANGNGGIMAVSGGGKSFAGKTEMISTLLKNPKDEIIILDPELEYTPIASQLKGVVIPVAPGTNTAINIMELPDSKDIAKDDNPVALKADFLISIFGDLVGGLSSTQRGIVDTVTNNTYRKYSNPSLQDWYEELKADVRPQAQELVGELEIYVTGSLNMFAKPTNVNTDCRLTIYDMHALKNEMSVLGYMVILDRVWNKVAANKRKGITTRVYFDEFQIIMTPSQNELLRTKAADIYSRIRKYGGIPTFMTQSAETMLSTEQGRSILFNSDFLILLEQKLDVYKAIVDKYELTPKQASYLKNPGKGKGLIIAGGKVIPFNNTIPSDTKLYKIMDTKVKVSE
ncbi:VirB4-like conjugal transfer ATPase, CD1110 family [Lactococcus lactis]